MNEQEKLETAVHLLFPSTCPPPEDLQDALTWYLNGFDHDNIFTTLVVPSVAPVSRIRRAALAIPVISGIDLLPALTHIFVRDGLNLVEKVGDQIHVRHNVSKYLPAGIFSEDMIYLRHDLPGLLDHLEKEYIKDDELQKWMDAKIKTLPTGTAAQSDYIRINILEDSVDGAYPAVKRRCSYQFDSIGGDAGNELVSSMTLGGIGDT